MFSFNPKLQKRDAMNKITFPLSKSRDLIAKNLSIPKQPNVSAGQNHHFHEKRLSKTHPGSCHNVLQSHISSPINLQIGPNPSTKVALKK
jgi:hypothetical protein